MIEAKSAKLNWKPYHHPYLGLWFLVLPCLYHVYLKHTSRYGQSKSEWDI